MTATSGDGDAPSNNYVAGNCGAGDCYMGEFRNFFQFSIPKLDGPVISAGLVLDSRSVTLQQSSSVVCQITSLADLFGFDDLGTGTHYGSVTYTHSSQNTVEYINLDEAALAAIESSEGGIFQLGGRIASPVEFGASEPDELVFGHSGGAEELEIVTGPSFPLIAAGALGGRDPATLDPPVPEPATAVLVGATLGAAVLLRHLRHKAGF